ncbi:MAG: hypothetical protein K2I46_07345, partial [Clostridia bacterium]|nr:hypothetical protein [Clostridia bacterium]
VIYKGFGCVDPNIACAQRISDSTGYPLLNSYDSAGGYKDWYVTTFQKLGLTIEVGDESVPYNELINYLPQMYEQNKDVLNIATQCAQ